LSQIVPQTCSDITKLRANLERELAVRHVGDFDVGPEFGATRVDRKQKVVGWPAHAQRRSDPPAHAQTPLMRFVVDSLTFESKVAMDQKF